MTGQQNKLDCLDFTGSYNAAENRNYWSDSLVFEEMSPTLHSLDAYQPQ